MLQLYIELQYTLNSKLKELYSVICAVTLVSVASCLSCVFFLLINYFIYFHYKCWLLSWSSLKEFFSHAPFPSTLRGYPTTTRV
jgi:hypothetical protein